MFRQRRVRYRRRPGPRRTWATGAAALATVAAAVIAVHLGTASRPLTAVSSAAYVSRAAGAGAGRAAHRGYGRGGDSMVTRAVQEATASTMNWSGYAAAGPAGSFTSVASSWTQPAVTCGTASSFSSFWAGLGGIGSGELEQTGTEADCDGGSAAYSGWFEFFPAAPVFYPERVEPGDQMSAAVAASQGGSFTLTLTDATQGWKKVASQSVPGAQLSSAEVIAEAPSSQSVLPLADFGTVSFTGATVNGQPISSDQPVAVALVSGNGTAEAVPSALAGNAFAVTWESGGTPAAGGGNGGSAGGTGGGDTSGGGHRHHHENRG